MSSEFRRRVEEIVANIPKGKVMSYSQVALLAGSPRSARIVGQIAHYGNSDLPWHRVVRANGSVASGFPGGMQVQIKLLEAEGVKFKDLIIDDINRYQL